jgi:hypothetical protein
MRSKKNGQMSPRLLRAASRFAAWRRMHVPHSRIPKSLWSVAVKLAVEFGISCTATALRLNYYDLKKHVESNESASRLPSAAKHMPAFVEWPASAVVATGEYVIELENAAGSKMRIHLKGPHAPDLMALSRSFWNPQQ